MDTNSTQIDDDIRAYRGKVLRRLSVLWGEDYELFCLLNSGVADGGKYALFSRGDFVELVIGVAGLEEMIAKAEALYWSRSRRPPSSALGQY
jgi:hypothetical protein